MTTDDRECTATHSTPRGESVLAVNRPPRGQTTGYGTSARHNVDSWPLNNRYRGGQPFTAQIRAGRVRLCLGDGSD